MLNLNYMINLKQLESKLKQVGGKNIIKIILISLGVFILVLAIFGFGMFVGYRKARFSYLWGENYHNLFGMPKGVPSLGPEIGPGKMMPPGGPRGFIREARGEDFINPNSVVGSVVKFDTNTLYILGNDNVEKSIFIAKDIIIRKGHDTLQLFDLKLDDKVIILGSPSSTGQIEAKFIRIMP